MLPQRSPYAGSLHSKEAIKAEGGFPAKLYTFTSALATSAFQDSISTKQYLLEMLTRYPEITQEPTMFAIAAAWGYRESDRPVRVIDILTYEFDKPWDTCNPDLDTWVIRNGSPVPGNKKVTCETTVIIAGKEAELRRSSSNLGEYLQRWPDVREFF